MSADSRSEIGLFLLAIVFALLGYGLPEHGGASYEPGPRDGTGLRVVTWNVGGSAGETGHPLEDDWLAGIAAALRRLDPDLALLQEVRDEEQLARLRALLGGEQWTTAIARAGSRHVAALAQHGRLRSFPVGPGARAALGLSYRSAGKPAVACVALHADAYAARERNSSIGRCAELLQRIDWTRCKVLAGDLNLDLDLDKRRELFTNDEHLDVETYNFVADRLTDAGLDRGNTADPDRRLDYVFVDPGAFRVVRAGPWKGQRVGDMDHDPMVADLAFLPRQGTR
jgi:endonuclease/exonuclease/phosphatase family metal-dependent hydrolase